MSMTLEEMERRLDHTTLLSGGMFFEPCNIGSSFAVSDAQDIKACLAEIKAKLPLVQMGLTAFTACEKMMFRFLTQHCEVACSVPQREENDGES